MLELAERLRNQRKLKGKTQNELAELLNVQRATYGEYERGNNLPPIDKLVIIADALNVSIDYLVGTKEKQNIDIVETLEVVKENLTTKRAFIGNKKLIDRTAEIIIIHIESILTIAKLLERS